MFAPSTDLPIELHDVSVRAGNVAIVQNISLEIRSGPPVVLIGPNGAGKTTLLRLAMGLMSPTSGRISWTQQPEPHGDKLAMVFQRPVMLRRSSASNVVYALRRKEDSSKRASELLARVGLSGFERRAARNLSGGEMQRLALARGLARDPEILFLDEPTASLDPASTKSVEDIIASIAKTGIKIVMATHDLGQARRLAGEILFLANGRLIERSPSEKFFQSPDRKESAAFLRGDLVL